MQTLESIQCTCSVAIANIIVVHTIKVEYLGTCLLSLIIIGNSCRFVDRCSKSNIKLN